MTFQVSEREVKHLTCPCCNAALDKVSGILEDHTGHWIYFCASAYEHNGREIYFDLVFPEHGEWERSAFTCRYGYVQGGQRAATMMDGAFTYPDDEFWGRKLARKEALRSSLAPGFWAATDFLLLSDPLLARYR